MVTGDVAADAAFAAVEKALADWTGGQAPDVKAPPVPALKGRTLVFVQRPNSVQSSISVGNFTVPRDDPRWLMLNVANQIYGGAFDSRLVRNIREEKGYTYSPQSQFEAIGTGRPLSRRRRRAQRRHRRDAQGDLRGDGRPQGAAGRVRRNWTSTKTYTRGLFVIQNATQGGLAGDAEHDVQVRPAEGLPGDLPEARDRR